jgi:GNAT superfamily N-acetyltransferase
MKAVLRQALRDDVPAMQVIRMSVRENRLESTVISEEQVIHVIENTGKGWVIEEDGEIAGFGIANREERNIWALFFHPDFEGRGYGRQILEVMTEWLWSISDQPIWLSTDPGTRAEGFYKKAGWYITGKMPNGEVRFEKRRPG